ncbi:multidrug DMT transporter permease [Terrihabitans soli]|uniref:Multidrug DMT transporter permease n=2 Tax=Terrihabitans soli TaxID=708113 RepID=A0A6S6QXB1_9HYPH|nr:multidrug DMT transporter permease [Terrihabitans soli]
MGRTEFILAALVLFAWSTSWIGVRLQLGVVAPEVSLLWRFLIAGLFMFGFCAVRGEKLSGFSGRDHLFFAGLGLTLFCMNFVLFYYGGLVLVSGMLAVVFALAAPINVIVQSAVLKRPVSWQVAAGSIVGVLGVAALFAPEIIENGYGHISGLVLATFGTFFFCTGNLLSARVQNRGIPLASATAWGMAYGSCFLLVLSLVRGQTFQIEYTVAYLGALLFLALIASVLAFMTYLSLLRRIGPARAGYLTVLFPVFALMISGQYEGYQWTYWSFIGIAAVAFGNVLVLWRSPHAAH